MRIIRIAQLDGDDDESFFLELQGEVENDERQSAIDAVNSTQYTLVHYGQTSGRKAVSRHGSPADAARAAVRLLTESIQTVMAREGDTNPRLPLHHADFKVVGPDGVETDLPPTAIPPFTVEYTQPGGFLWRVSFFNAYEEDGDELSPAPFFIRGTLNAALEAIRHSKRSNPRDKTIFRVIDAAGCVVTSTGERHSGNQGGIGITRISAGSGNVVWTSGYGKADPRGTTGGKDWMDAPRKPLKERPRTTSPVPAPGDYDPATMPFRQLLETLLRQIDAGTPDPELAERVRHPFRFDPEEVRISFHTMKRYFQRELHHAISKDDLKKTEETAERNVQSPNIRRGIIASIKAILFKSKPADDLPLKQLATKTLDCLDRGGRNDNTAVLHVTDGRWVTVIGKDASGVIFTKNMAPLAFWYDDYSCSPSADWGDIMASSQQLLKTAQNWGKYLQDQDDEEPQEKTIPIRTKIPRNDARNKYFKELNKQKERRTTSPDAKPRQPPDKPTIPLSDDNYIDAVRRLKEQVKMGTPDPATVAFVRMPFAFDPSSVEPLFHTLVRFYQRDRLNITDRDALTKDLPSSEATIRRRHDVRRDVEKVVKGIINRSEPLKLSPETLSRITSLNVISRGRTDPTIFVTDGQWIVVVAQKQDGSQKAITIMPTNYFEDETLLHVATFNLKQWLRRAS